ncbi:MAG: HAD family hydrolase [Betaproteobacteria bacterium]
MPLDLGRIRALCFDVDGTLNDTDDQYAGIVKRLLKPLDVFPFSDRDRIARRFVMWAEAPGNALLGYADRIGVDDQAAALVEWMNRHRPRKPKNFQPIDGVAEMLNSLDGHYLMAVVSARDERSTRLFLEQCDLARHFTCVTTAQTCKHTKPFPDPLLWAAKQMGVPPESCLMIGDTTVDIRAGRSAGAQTVGVLCGFGEEDELRRIGADEILMSTAELGEQLLDNGER